MPRTPPTQRREPIPADVELPELTPELKAAAEEAKRLEDALEAELVSPAAPDPVKVAAIPEIGEETMAVYRERYPGLTDEDIREALGDARDQIEAAARENQRKLLIKAEKERLRVEEGLVTGASVLDELVEIVIDCQDWQNPLRINGREYHNGWLYKVPRHLANSILEMQGRGRALQRDLDGQSYTEFYRKAQAPTLSAVKGLVH